jgi:hypothetical protein
VPPPLPSKPALPPKPSSPPASNGFGSSPPRASGATLFDAFGEFSSAPAPAPPIFSPSLGPPPPPLSVDLFDPQPRTSAGGATSSSATPIFWRNQAKYRTRMANQRVAGTEVMRPPGPMMVVVPPSRTAMPPPAVPG